MSYFSLNFVVYTERINHTCILAKQHIVVRCVMMMIIIIKNLQAKFKEDQEACTFDGSVDWHGRPAIRAKSGRWVAGIIILCKQLLTHDDFLKGSYLRDQGKSLINLINKIS